MHKVVLDAFIDSAKTIPLLLIIYAVIEFVESRYGGFIREKVKHAGKTGPAFGTFFGCVPQCGFSVIATALYTKRLITVGTLLAVYLSTSDEAIPVILSQPSKINLVLPLIAAKVIIALVAGYLVDFILNKSQKAKTQVCATSDESCYTTVVPPSETNGIDQTGDIDETGCCGHHCTSEKFNYNEIILHPLIHTLKVFLFIFAVSLTINYIIFRVGEQNLGHLLLNHSIFQPFAAALVGLIPNCAASIAITQVFLKGGISFGSAVAGLSASAGLGTLVLFRENKDTKDTLRIVLMLFGISVVAGIIIQYVFE